jgi:Kef-type K+ transport system membrane component KefB
VVPLQLLEGEIFYQVAAILVLASAVGIVGLLLRQPVIVSFIAVGIIAGPSGLGIVHPAEHIELLAELGIAVLLFLVGLKLDLHLVRTLGPVALMTGLGQVAFTSVFGFLICLGLGLSPIASLYVAVALTFSSTIIIVKLLSDKREIDSLHGRIALGFLIVQDLVVVLAMVVLSALGVGAAGASPWDIGRIVLSGVVLVGLVLLFIRYVAEPLLQRVARSPELLVSLAIGWAAFFAALGDVLGLGKEIGGLLAGVSLGSGSYREAISSRLSSLRDFLLLFFFLALGSQLEVTALGGQILPAILLSLFVLVGNPLIVMVIMGYMGYRKRTGFLAGLTVAQISEFSLIFMAMGLTIGHVDEDTVGLVTLVGLVTIATSTYMIVHSHRLYDWLEPWLGSFERRQAFREAGEAGGAASGRFDVLLFGLGRYGTSIHERLTARGRTVLGVDFDPEVVRLWQARGRSALYGDATDSEFLSHLPLGDVDWVVVAVPFHREGVTHQDPRNVLLDTLERSGRRARVAAAAHHAGDAARLRERGVEVVLMPFRDAADRAVELILDEPAKP